jgi:hypothetical protein
MIAADEMQGSWDYLTRTAKVSEPSLLLGRTKKLIKSPYYISKSPNVKGFDTKTLFRIDGSGTAAVKLQKFWLGSKL